VLYPWPMNPYLCWPLEVPGLMYPLVHYATLVDKDLYAFVLSAVPKLGPLSVGQSGLVVCWHQPFELLNSKNNM